MPAEFEPQQCLVLSCGELTERYARTLACIAAETCHNVSLYILYSTREQRELVRSALREQAVDERLVNLVSVVHDTKWVRDYGPTTLTCPEHSCFVDWWYRPDRQFDDSVPRQLATLSDTTWSSAPIAMEGGNIVSNGRGLILTTSSNLDEKLVSDTAISTDLVNWLGNVSIIVLQPMAGEPTGHVDMFATFLAPNLVVVAECDPQADAENAAILDANAARLRDVQTDHGCLRVERVPLGWGGPDVCHSYTNCIFANGVLVVPAYRGEERRNRNAIALYRRLLPGWRIVAMDATELIAHGGSLHCISLNIPRWRRPLQSTISEAPLASLRSRHREQRFVSRWR